MILFCSLIFFGIITINGEKLPSDIPQCHSEDLQCIIKTSNGLIKKFHAGRADLKIPSIDPFFLKNVLLNLPGGNSIDLKIILNDVNITGLSSLVLDKAVGFTKDPTTSKFELYGRIPKLEFNGKYKASGRVLVLPFKGDGNFKCILKDSKISYKFKPKVYKKSDGLTYLKIDQIKFKLDPKSFFMNLENLFNGNKELGDSMNAVINENWKDLWVELAPPLLEVAVNIIKGVTVEIFDRFNYDDIYLD